MLHVRLVFFTKYPSFLSMWLLVHQFCLSRHQPTLVMSSLHNECMQQGNNHTMYIHEVVVVVFRLRCFITIIIIEQHIEWYTGRQDGRCGHAHKTPTYKTTATVQPYKCRWHTSEVAYKCRYLLYTHHLSHPPRWPHTPLLTTQIWQCSAFKHIQHHQHGTHNQQHKRNQAATATRSGFAT